MKTIARVLALVLAFQFFAPTPRVIAAVTELPLSVTVGTPRANPLLNTIDVPVTVRNDLGYAVPGPIALASYADPLPTVPPGPGLFQPYLLGKYGPLYPDGASEPWPSYVDLHTGLAPGQSATQVLRFFNRDNVIAELDDIRTFAVPPNPHGLWPFPTSFPTTGGPIDITTGAPLDVPGSLPGDVRAWRTLGWVMHLFQYDFDAANLNGGTLVYSIVPVPTLPPSLAGAAFPAVINIDADGVVRWFPPAIGLYAFRILVWDGLAQWSGAQDIIIDVLDPATPLASDPILCLSGSKVLDPGVQLVPSPYDVLKPGDPFIVGRANVYLAEGRQMSCYPSKSGFMGPGTNTVSCRTVDGLYPADSCSFDIEITNGAPPPVPDPPDLQVSIHGEERFQNGQLLPNGQFVVERYLEPNVTDRGNAFITVVNAGDQPAADTVVRITLPRDSQGDRIPNGSWGLIPNREGSCIENETEGLDCTFGTLEAGGRIEIKLILEPYNEHQLLSQVDVWSSSTESSLANNSQQLIVLEGAGPIRFPTPPPPEQQCGFREDIARIHLAALIDVECVFEDLPWLRWVIMGVLTAVSVATAGTSLILGSQTLIGGALRASWVFRAHEVVGLIR